MQEREIMKMRNVVIAVLATLGASAKGIISTELYTPKLTQINDMVKVEMVSSKKKLPFAGSQNQVYFGPLLNTQGNKVGIDETDVCTAIAIRNKDTLQSTKTVICNSGKRFSYREETVPSTGTPSYVENPNYIGSYIAEKARTIGGGKRVVLFKE